MRQIKIRAWDKIEKKWWFPILKPDGRLMVSNQIGGYVTYDDPQDPIVQFTGFKDKKDTDIFIVDIVKLALIRGDFFSEVKVCETREIPVVKFFEDEGWEPLHRYAGHDKDDTCLEVIGTTLENPDLL